MVEIAGKIPGLDYEIKGGDPCVLCDSHDVPILVSRVSQNALGICESCAVLSEWAFRRAAGETLPEYPIKDVTKIDAALVLVIKVAEWKREEHTFYESSVLMVERAEEANFFTLPGGHVGVGEQPEEAVVRWLGEQTSCTTWPLALETIHTGLSLRGKLIRVYLARAWAGEPRTRETGPKAVWKSLPMVSHVGQGASFIVGVEEAYERKREAWSKTLAGSQSGASISVKLRKAAAVFLEKKLVILSKAGLLSDSERADVESEINAAYYVMNDEEKAITKDVIASWKTKNMAPGAAAEPPEKKVTEKKSDGFAREKFVAPSQGDEGAADE